MTIMTDIINELDALSRSTEPLEVIRKKAESIRKKLHGKLAYGCKWKPVPSNYSPQKAKIGSLPSPFWVNVHNGQSLDIITVSSDGNHVNATVKDSPRHSGSSVVTLVNKES